MLPGKQGAAIAINQAAVFNSSETFLKMGGVGPKVCMTTANSPEFIGFHALLQVGAHPLGGRFGAAQVVAAESLEKVMESPTHLRLNPLHLWQYTMWESADAHEKMHHENFNRIFELCSHCLGMVVEGPWEPMFEVVAEDMPPLLGVTDVPAVMAQSFIKQEPVPKVRLPFRRVIAVGEHKIKEGSDTQFVCGAVDTLRLLKEKAAGMIGWMILKKIGDSGLGPMQFTPPYFWEALETLGANPPSKLLTNYGEWGKDYHGVAVPHKGHPEYLVHMEWENPDLLAFGLSLTAVNPTIRQIHDAGVMVHLAQVPPYYRVFVPLMEDMVFFH